MSTELELTSFDAQDTALQPSDPRQLATSVMAGAQNSREMTEVQSRVYLAMSVPRNEKTALDKIINACQRVGLAEKATYVYKRGGTDITGPSIRLAEAIAQHWRNIDFGFRPLQTRRDDRGRNVTTVEAYAWDMENNTRKCLVFDVPHIRYTKKGEYPLTDPRDIYEMIANQASRRVRNCILAIIPGDIIDDALTECNKTLHTKVNLTKERILSMVEKFANYGVTQEMLEKRIQRHIDAITPQQFVHLGRIYTSMEDGIGKPDDYFELEEPNTKERDAVAALRERAIEREREISEPSEA